ncbi:3-hydroxyacyl-CoA dehydrogenase NAD-binding domain-containing protein [bacterium]|nr:3-hydroxyacyl-CoA dehydrogenase NAD-binding domain-containing protein [bacterium]NUN45104.1 3-hydroxyacyl-CoA dehydrogenase [bacterium]
MAVQTITVLGSGIMGNGIAHVAAQAGYKTILHDVSLDALNKALNTISKNLDKGIELGKISVQDKEATLSRISVEQHLEAAVAPSDFVIEAVPEKIDLKIKIYTTLDKTCKPETIFATNTSSLSITEIAAVTQRPQKCIGMHFFNPVHKMKLVEIIKALETDEATIKATQDVATAMGKEIVTIKESPGFITSRINALIGNEAFYMLQEGIGSAKDIDTALKLGLNHPMGPFEMVDLVGLDTRLSILEYLHKSLGEKYKPCPLMVQYVKAGRLGRKTGKGVHEYPDVKK